MKIRKLRRIILNLMPLWLISVLAEVEHLYQEWQAERRIRARIDALNSRR